MSETGRTFSISLSLHLPPSKCFKLITMQVSAVQVMDVLYQNIKGTSASEVAINLQCSNDRPCRHVLLQDVNLVGVGGDSAKSLCSNVQWIKRGTVIPPPRVHD